MERLITKNFVILTFVSVAFFAGCGSEDTVSKPAQFLPPTQSAGVGPDSDAGTAPEEKFVP